MNIDVLLVLHDVVELADDEVVGSHLVVEAVCLLSIHLDDDDEMMK